MCRVTDDRHPPSADFRRLLLSLQHTGPTAHLDPFRNTDDEDEDERGMMMSEDDFLWDPAMPGLVMRAESEEEDTFEFDDDDDDQDDDDEEEDYEYHYDYSFHHEYHDDHDDDVHDGNVNSDEDETSPPRRFAFRGGVESEEGFREVAFHALLLGLYLTDAVRPRTRNRNEQSTTSGEDSEQQVQQRRQVQRRQERSEQRRTRRELRQVPRRTLNRGQQNRGARRRLR